MAADREDLDLTSRRLGIEREALMRGPWAQNTGDLLFLHETAVRIPQIITTEIMGQWHHF
jgi:hypothetical protein